MSCCAKCGYPACNGFCSQACMDQQEITRLRALLKECDEGFRSIDSVCCSNAHCEAVLLIQAKARALREKLKVELEAAG